MLPMKKIAVTILMGACFSTPNLFATEQKQASDPITTQVTSSGLSWASTQQQSGFGLQLTVSGPNDWYFQRTFSAGQTATFTPSDNPAGTAPDGSYTYEVVSVVVGTSKSRLTGPADSSPTVKTSGAFMISGGQIIGNDGTAEGSTVKDIPNYDDVFVAGSLCVGQDCANNESFGYDTIRLKENNLRIRFFDTSNSASFPSRDWQITVNDATNGGANKFSIDDIDGSKTPFTIEAGAPSHSLYVDDGGRVGLGKSTPVVELHIVDGDSPTLRLEQDGSSGFTPQTWDVAGNETNFFIRDASNGSTLPLRIRPGAPTDSLYIKENGFIGLGTSNPSAKLHIKGANASTDTLFRIERGTPHATDQQILFEVLDDGSASLMKVLAQGSDRNIKKNIESVDTAEILEKIT
ncbi:MAG: hypothetical protein MI754_15620, partial [Chromatiales bacterium]|nr:hypothetical protein [Chromatiales bacterium]